jgi:hypothetical protein
MSSTTGFIYCIHNDVYNTYGTNVYKLGRTINLNARKSTYNTGFIKNSKYLIVSREFHNCIKAERILFFILRKYRIKEKKEFFNASIDLIKSTFDRINNFSNEFIDILYSHLLNKFCKDDIIERLENGSEEEDEEFSKFLINDYNELTNFFEQFRYKPSQKMIELFPSFKYLLDLPELNALVYTSEDSLINNLDPSVNTLSNNFKKINIKPSFQWFIESDSE